MYDPGDFVTQQNSLPLLPPFSLSSSFLLSLTIAETEPPCDLGHKPSPLPCSGTEATARARSGGREGMREEASELRVGGRGNFGLPRHTWEAACLRRRALGRGGKGRKRGSEGGSKGW